VVEREEQKRNRPIITKRERNGNAKTHEAKISENGTL
jgi:hypothetical protein